jgi:iron complex transport system ATP-binding protein
MIETVDLSLSAAGHPLVEALSWRAAAGECWCVIGPNGAGKSTLLRALAGLRTPDRGHVLLGDRPLASWPLPELARMRAYLPQSRGDAFAYSVIDTVLVARHPWQGGRYWEGSEDHAAAEHALALLDVLDLAGRDVRTLSGGERQRVAIARALSVYPPVLLADEPTGNLDTRTGAEILTLIRDVHSRLGCTVVIVTHDMTVAQSCQRTIALRDGRIVEDVRR